MDEFIKCKPGDIAEGTSPPTMEQIKEMDQAFFGSETDSTSELKWEYIRKDNYMVRSLQKAVGTLTHVLVQQIRAAEKDIKRAEKVFYG